MVERLTEVPCWDLFQRLIPNGLDDRYLLDELAPEGWNRSPLLLISNPTAEQVYAETILSAGRRDQAIFWCGC